MPGSITSCCDLWAPYCLQDTPLPRSMAGHRVLPAPTLSCSSPQHDPSNIQNTTVFSNFSPECSFPPSPLLPNQPHSSHRPPSFSLSNSLLPPSLPVSQREVSCSPIQTPRGKDDLFNKWCQVGQKSLATASRGLRRLSSPRSERAWKQLLQPRASLRMMQPHLPT